MTDLTQFISLMEGHGQFKQMERLDIFDGDVELSLPITDMLSMHYVHVKFRFASDGAFKWIDVEVR